MFTAQRSACADATVDQPINGFDQPIGGFVMRLGLHNLHVFMDCLSLSFQP